MTQDPCSSMAHYFQKISAMLQSEKEASAVFPNPSDKGQTREDAVKRFLKAHLPSRCNAISGGYVFDMSNASKQLDLIITSDLTMQFRQFGDGGKSFTPIEGCYGIVSVKSTLDKTSIRQCLEEFQSVPDAPEPKINPTLKPADSLLEQMPFKVVFAFSGSSPDAIIGHMEDFFKENGTPNSKKPNMIIANDSYLIEKTLSTGGTLRDGTPVDPHRYVPMHNAKFASLGLFRLICQVQNISNLGSQMLLDYGKYDAEIGSRLADSG